MNNIYVFTSDYRRFQGFLQDFHCREHFGDGPKMGQVRYLRDADHVRGLTQVLVLVVGEGHNPRILAELRANPRVALVYVPMTDFEAGQRREYARRTGHRV